MRLGALIILAGACLGSLAFAQNADKYEYRLLATTRTSTMEKELNQAADGGYVFAGLIGGGEAIVVMVKATGADAGARRSYKFIATSRTSTMEKELQQGGDEGFTLRDFSAYKKEIVAVLERIGDAPPIRTEFKLLATSRTSTMQKELLDAGEAGFRFRSVAFRGEVLSLLERPAK